jgi:phosphoribosylanthranilate isomerase
MIQVKICGITNKEDALAALEAGADALGFIFYPGSKRFIKPDVAGNIIRQLPPFITPVGVFVNNYPADIELACRVSGIGMVQLSGDEQPTALTGITLPVIKTLHIGETFQVDKFDFDAYGKVHFLLDSAGSWGGSGKTANWQICMEIAKKFKVILAGGLTPDNVAEAIRRVLPAAVDVSSGVEKAPGIKDHEKLQAFISTVKKIYNL